MVYNKIRHMVDLNLATACFKTVNRIGGYDWVSGFKQKKTHLGSSRPLTEHDTLSCGVDMYA